MISLAASVGRVGDGSVVWTGGLSELDCCSPVAKCSKDEVGNGRIMGFGGMGCDLCGASVGDGGTGVLSGLGVVGTVVRPLPSVQRMKSATGESWDLRGWAVIFVVRTLGVGMGRLIGLGGCLNCCSPVAKCPKDEVGNGRIMGFGGWAGWQATGALLCGESLLACRLAGGWQLGCSAEA